MDYTVISLTNPHTIRGRPTLKDVERFRNGSFHEFCRLKALITLKEVNQGGLATAFDLAAFRPSMIAPVKKSVNHPRTVVSMRVKDWE